MTDHYEMPHARADECPHAGVGKACRPCRDRFERAPITPDERAAIREYAERLHTYGGEEQVLAEGTLRLLDALDTTEYERDEESVAARLNLSRAERAEEEIERLARPAPAWDEDAVTEAAAQRGFDVAAAKHGSDRYTDEQRHWATISEDEREMVRTMITVALAVVREHLPTRPDRAPQAEPDGSHVYAFDETEGCWIAYRRVDCVSAEELPGNALWPGRSEATVKAEALRETRAQFVADDNDGGDWWDNEGQRYGRPSEWLDARADRIEKEK